MNQVVYGCLKYGWKGGIVGFYREALGVGVESDLDRLVRADGGVIYEYYERADGEPKLLCEDLSVVNVAVINAAVGHFYAE